MATSGRVIRTIVTEWRNSYSVGVEELDFQHQTLLKLINELDQFLENRQEASSKARSFAALNALVKYAEIHFGTEEGYLSKYAYPKFDLQKKEHEEFIDTVFSMNARFEKDSFYSLNEIVNFLRDWYSLHILGMDQGYKQFLAEKGAEAEKQAPVGTD
jgi:hemerythrin